jgi:hypothetical protein
VKIHCGTGCGISFFRIGAIKKRFEWFAAFEDEYEDDAEDEDFMGLIVRVLVIDCLLLVPDCTDNN